MTTCIRLEAIRRALKNRSTTLINMTAKEKARKVAAAWSAKTGCLSADGSFFKSLCADIELALKEQDRDTRHACAKAVLTADDPHAACMNAVAV